jgi:hypothetical protein
VLSLRRLLIPIGIYGVWLVGFTKKSSQGIFYERLHEHFSGTVSGTFPRKPGNERQGNYALGLCCFLRVTHRGTRII